VFEHGVYVKCWHNCEQMEKLIVCLYVDDLLVIGRNESIIIQFKSQMLSEFEMSDLGKLNYFMGIEFVNTKYEIGMDQSKYTHGLLSKFNMSNLQVHQLKLVWHWKGNL